MDVGAPRKRGAGPGALPCSVSLTAPAGLAARLQVARMESLSFRPLGPASSWRPSAANAGGQANQASSGALLLAGAKAPASSSPQGRGSVGPLSGLRDRVRSGATARARQRWVQRATEAERENVRAEDWRRIVAEVCEAGEARWLCQNLRERPVLSDHVVAFRALVVIHRVLQHGPAEAASELATVPGGLLDALGSTWAASASSVSAVGSSASSRPAQVQHCVQAVAEYAQVLAAKAELMLEGDAGRGHFDGSMVFSHMLLEPSDLLQALAMLLNFAERLMPLALHLVSPSKDWRRLERSQYMRLYLASIFSLLDEAWLLLCAVSLFVKNLLTQVHAAKQCERTMPHGSNGSRPWLQLSLHLLAAQPRFARFHAAVCDFVAHCHQLRCAGFTELGAHIPMVPQGLLNLFAGLEELVNNRPALDVDKALRPHQSSLSSASTTAGSAALAADSSPEHNAWEPSPCVLDALRTVDRLQQSALLTGHHSVYTAAVSTDAPEAAAPASSAGAALVSSGPVPGRLSNQRRPQARGYMLLEEESDAGEPLVARLVQDDSSVSLHRAEVETTSSTEEQEHAQEEVRSSRRPQALLDAAAAVAWPEERSPSHKSTNPMAMADTPTSVASETPVLDAGPPSSAPPPLPGFPTAAVAAGHSPPHWAAAICRSQASRNEASAPLFTSPLWEAAPATAPPAVPMAAPALASEADTTLRGGSLSQLKGRGREPASPARLQEPTQPHSARRHEVPLPLNPFDLSTAQLQRASAHDGRRPSLDLGAQERPPLLLPMEASSPASPSKRADGSPAGPFAARAMPSPAAPGSKKELPQRRGSNPSPFRQRTRSASAARSGERDTSAGAPPPGVAYVRSPTEAHAQRAELPLARVVGEAVPAGEERAGASPKSDAVVKGLPQARKAHSFVPPLQQQKQQPQLQQQQHREGQLQRAVAPAHPMAASLQPAQPAQAGMGAQLAQMAPAAYLQPGHPNPRSPQTRAPQQPQIQVASVGSEWEVDPTEIRLDELLGSGSTAEVYRGSWHGTDVAVKKLRVSGPLPVEFTREISVLLHLRHPNLVLFMGASTQGPPLIISEYCAGGTVFALLHQRPDVPLPWNQRVKIAIDVAKGMNFLHRRQVVHRDLKSLNLLLAGHLASHEDLPTVKVSDFGLSRAWLPEQSKSQVCMTSGAGTYHWMAPEVLDGQWYNEKVDVYSYGIVLFEILARRIPYDGSGLEPVSIAVAVSKGRRPDAALVPQDCPADLRFTMECCWAHCPTGRPGFDTILETLKLVQCS